LSGVPFIFCLLDKISCWRSANHWYYWVTSDPIITLRPYCFGVQWISVAVEVEDKE